MFAKYSPLKLDGKYGKALGARVKVNSSISAVILFITVMIIVITEQISET